MPRPKPASPQFVYLHTDVALNAPRVPLALFTAVIAKASMTFLAKINADASAHANAEMERARKRVDVRRKQLEAARKARRRLPARDPDMPDMEPADLYIKRKGSEAYHARRQERLDEPRPEYVKVVITPAGLLAGAGIAREGRSYARLKLYLERLRTQRPHLRKERVPVLMDWQRSKTQPGKLLLWVDGRWLLDKGDRYVKVPLPLPKQKRVGAAVQVLYLFLFGIGLFGRRANKRNEIKLESLFSRVRISSAKPSNALRALMRALNAVNEHLLRLGVDSVELEYVGKKKVRLKVIKSAKPQQDPKAVHNDHDDDFGVLDLDTYFRKLPLLHAKHMEMERDL